MASNYIAKGLKRSALTVALGLCFVGGVQAQTNTGGAINGSATAGDTITISKLVQWWDNDSWMVVGNVAWDVAPGFKAEVEASYADGKNWGNLW